MAGGQQYFLEQESLATGIPYSTLFAQANNIDPSRIGPSGEITPLQSDITGWTADGQTLYGPQYSLTIGGPPYYPPTPGIWDAITSEVNSAIDAVTPSGSFLWKMAFVGIGAFVLLKVLDQEVKKI